jgi:hypothetical protein
MRVLAAAVALTVAAAACRSQTPKPVEGTKSPVTPARQALSAPPVASSASPADSAAAVARPRLFELEPVAQEPPFVIALNAEDSVPVAKNKTKRFTCTAPERPNCVNGYVYHEGVRRFELAEDDFTDAKGISRGDRGDHRDPTLFVDNRGSPNCFGGVCRAEARGHSFLFEGFDSSAHPRVERFELQIAPSGGSADEVMEFGEWRYLRYFIKIHPKFEPSQDDVLITQIWQRNSNPLFDESGVKLRDSVGPRLSVNLTATADLPPNPSCSVPPGPGTVNAQFAYRNDSNNEWAAKQGKGRMRVPFLTCALPKNTWLGFLIAMRPMHEPLASTDPKERGTILVWKLDTATGLSFGPKLPLEKAANYDPADDSKYRFYWGSRPERKFSTPPDPHGGFTNRFDIRVGMFRSSSLYSALWFDDIKLTNSEACLPGTEPTCQ